MNNTQTTKKRILFWKIPFFILVSVMVLYLIFGEIFLPREVEFDDSQAKVYDESWVWLKPDGTSEQVEVPNRFAVEKGTPVVLETVLPDYVCQNTYIGIRSTRQEMQIYIDGELRTEFTTKDTRLFGVYNPVAYVFIPVGSEDAGKVMRVSAASTSTYSGVMSEVYYGDYTSLWILYVRENFIPVVLALFLLLFSVIIIIFSIISRIIIKRYIEIEHLGWAGLMLAVWMLCESRLRQLIFPNISVASDVSFIAATLMIFPFCGYYNSVQKFRYRKMYYAVYTVILSIFLVNCTLHILGIKDFSDTMFITHGCILLGFLTVGLGMFRDFRRKKLGEYRLVFVGYCVLLAAGADEIVRIYYSGSHNEALAAATVTLFAIAAFKAGQDILQMEREKQDALSVSQAQNNFLANMSHEIRTPINTIIGMNELILREGTEPQIKEYAVNVGNAGRMLLTLVNDILDFTKMESGNVELVENTYHLASLLNDEVQMIREKADKKGLQLNVSIDENLPANLIGDEVRIKQVLTNLLTNAVKYTEKGSVTLMVLGNWQSADKFMLKMCVQDTGMGMHEEDVKHLFDRFSRFDRKKNSTIEGSGLGMAITKCLIDMMNGQISVESTYGEGSVFTVTIPQTAVNKAPLGNLQQAYQQETISRKQYRESFHAPDARILVVDDNRMNLAVAKGLLKRTEIKVDTAGSGLECLSMTRAKKYHLILMDHMMPEMDGIETFHRLQAEEDNPNRQTPVIALTANAISGSREEYIKEGFVDYISKPIDALKLENTLLMYLPKELVLMKEPGEDSAAE